ncbi:histidine kinase [Methylocystis parvus]|uniref:histidine kinase n=1 Tax=Methylocystis parvus TaxID=134 RepID=UPI000360C3FB|nr:histidine kinase [Methylocystis parvus]WBK02405.1 histidine kinase [Methylocystis parvus OBBP]
MTIDNGPSRKRVRVIETFALGLLYLFLVTSFFGVAAYLTGWDANRSRPEGFVGRSTTVDLTSGILSFAIMSGAVWALRGCKIVYNIVLCFAASALVAAADFFSVMAFFRMFHANAEDMFICWMMYLGWCCVTQMLLFYFDVQDREHRLAVAREEALAVQMQALRYQVNPHFLFNALNSIAGLIEEGAPTQAERMVLSLSTFTYNSRS